MVVGGIVLGLLLPAGRPAVPPSADAASAAAAPVAAVPAVSPGVLQPPAPPPMAALGETLLQRGLAGHFQAVAQVNTVAVDFVVDTGADTVALTQADALRAGVAFDASQFSVIGRGASGPVRGQAVTIPSIMLDGKEAVNVDGVVLESGEQSLLGHSYLRHLSAVEISGDTMRLR